MEELCFPALPDPPANSAWPYTVISAYEVIRKKFESAVRALHSDDGDLERLRYLTSTLESDCLPLLMNLEQTTLPMDFVDACFEDLTEIAVLLEDSIEAIRDT
jgi:hypothetical protein